MKTKLRNQKGFTIIEVLIVLAIAGLILLIVFLAVPALQRNSRNTSAKNDVSAVLGGISEFQAANNGQMPADISGTGVILYEGTNDTEITIQGTTEVIVDPADPADVGLIHINIGEKCNGDANNRAASARYLIETRTGTVADCIDS